MSAADDTVVVVAMQEIDTQIRLAIKAAIDGGWSAAAVFDLVKVLRDVERVQEDYL